MRRHPVLKWCIKQSTIFQKWMKKEPAACTAKADLILILYPCFIPRVYTEAERKTRRMGRAELGFAAGHIMHLFPTSKQPLISCSYCDS